MESGAVLDMLQKGHLVQPSKIAVEKHEKLSLT